ncbi:MAG: YciI family protein [Litoreibacter sp.]|nr:YciI family protein [Litoreibacter sp.]
MRIAIICTDKPGHLEVRKSNRDAHLDYLKTTGVVAQAGPFLDNDGNMSGSLLILDLPDMAAAGTWAANDPYAKAGLFSDVRIEQWNKVIG